MDRQNSEGAMSLLATATPIALVLVFIVIAASAYLRLDQVGSGCADWPACYGARFAVPVTTVKGDALQPSLIVALVRITHRVAAAGIGLLVAVIAVSCFRARHNRPESMAIAVALVALTLFLAVLGWATQGSRLPAITLGNLLGGMTMLALLWWLWLRTVNRDRACGRGGDRRLAFWAWLGLVVLALQIGLGAMVSAGYAAASCMTVPDCHGAWWSAEWPLSAFNPWREASFSADGTWQSDPARQALHMAHRIGALAATGCLSWLAVLLLRRGGTGFALGLKLLGLLMLQIVLGAAAVYSWFGLPPVLLHNTASVFLVLTVVSAIFYSRPSEVASVSAACHMATSK